MFIEATEFPFLARLQKDWELILGELQGLYRGHFSDWPERDIYQGGWKVFGLYKFGKKLPEFCRLCPRTTDIIEEIPGLETAGFSSLAPMTHITPHAGYTNRVLRCHLGLVIPENCAIRVGQETRHWYPGSCFVIDDTIEHEAWNRSDRTRIVFLLDFKRDPNEVVDYPAQVMQYEPSRKLA